jgi:hypothetical protein
VTTMPLREAKYLISKKAIVCISWVLEYFLWVVQCLKTGRHCRWVCQNFSVCKTWVVKSLNLKGVSSQVLKKYLGYFGSYILVFMEFNHTDFKQSIRISLF